MKANSLTSATVAIAILLMTSAATNPAPDPAAKPRTDEMNVVVCEKQEVVGSRLATRRVCQTRAQWADQRLQDRQDLERVQVQRGSCEGKACQ